MDFVVRVDRARQRIGRPAHDAPGSLIGQEWHSPRPTDSRDARGMGWGEATGWVTAIIAGAVAFVSYQQWQVARAKLLLDLFEKRFAVYLDARRLVSEAVQMGKFTDDAMPNEVLAKGRFLFGDEIVAELTKLQELCVRARMKDPAVTLEMGMWLDDFNVKVVPYLALTHRL